MSPSTTGIVVKAAAATAAITLVLSGIFYLLFKKFTKARRRRKIKIESSFHREESVVAHEVFRKLSGNVKGLIVDENGLDVLYLRKYEGGQLKTGFPKIMVNPSYEKDLKRVNDMEENQNESRPKEVPFLHEKSDVVVHSNVAKPALSIPSTMPTRASEPPPVPPPPPLPIPAKRKPLPPPPPPKAGGLALSSKPPPAPRWKENKCRPEAAKEESFKGTTAGQMKLKPLHWEKVIANGDHSMVWDQINNGSLRFDDELIEALFGYAPNKHMSPAKAGRYMSSSSSNATIPTQIFILEPRKSQNTAIVLRSLAVSRKEVLEALLDGQGLSTDTLEKLTKISPSQEEEAKILQFTGNPTKLADAESFLYTILKAVPSAFTRLHAMLFRANYDSEILHLKESLQTLELGCKELKTRGIFLKLLEAILKAGNKMNAGTARGNAQGFNLSALRKLSDVKSTDGKTTLLHFVVEQVVWSEGRRIVINRNYSLGRSNTNTDLNIECTNTEDTEKQCLKLGSLMLAGLSTQLSNVKKAAAIEHDSFINLCSILSTRATEIRQLIIRCSTTERGGFVREMKGFLEECEQELEVVREEQIRVMDIVKRTTDYYQAGASKDKGVHPLQLFVMVKDFLTMVDQVRIDIAKKLDINSMKKHHTFSRTTSNHSHDDDF